MDKKDSLWQKFYTSGKINDYLAYCVVREGNCSDNDKRTSDVGRLSGAGNERR